MQFLRNSSWKKEEDNNNIFKMFYDFNSTLESLYACITDKSTRYPFLNRLNKKGRDSMIIAAKELSFRPNASEAPPSSSVLPMAFSPALEPFLKSIWVTTFVSEWILCVKNVSKQFVVRRVRIS